MKISVARSEAFLRSPGSEVRAVLLYGPNAGLVRERADRLAAAIAPPGDPFRTSELSPDDLKNDPARLNDEAQALSLGGGRRVVRLRGATDAVAKAFGAIVRARDAGIALVQQAAADGRDLRGWEVDRAARTVLEQAGFGTHILQRTGHSLGEEVHGNGVHMDDFETHDDRRLLPGPGFTIEPGVYFSDFGVRSEINMIVGERGAAVTGAVQTDILVLG